MIEHGKKMLKLYRKKKEEGKNGIRRNKKTDIRFNKSILSGNFLQGRKIFGW